MSSQGHSGTNPVLPVTVLKEDFTTGTHSNEATA